MSSNRPFGGMPSPTERVQRVYRLLAREGKPMPRDRIMLVCGFPSPKDEPINGYAMFAVTVDRLNRALNKQGKGVRCMGGIETGEMYWLSGGTP